MSSSDTASLNTKLPVDEKKLFTETAASLGMTPSAAIRVFVCKFNEYQGFPFAVRRAVPMSDIERREIELLDKAIDLGTAETYKSFSELLAEIDAEIVIENES
ncbi:MAG: hypothetical protein LBI64_06195, partial [Coriobacteriales bacterium]|nr:hypothetical protein [Coriobacteriales bacterium]